MMTLALMLLAFDSIQWLEVLVVPVLVAIIVGTPAFLTALKMLHENRSQHGDNGDRLDAVREEVAGLRSDLGAVSDKLDRFINRTEAWRDHVEDHIV